MSVKSVIKEVLSEPGSGGTLSWGRCASSVALMASLAWVTRLILVTHALPDLTGITGFTLAPYAAGKAAAAAQAYSNNPITPQPPQQPPAGQ